MGSERSANPAQIRAPLFIGYIQVSAANSGLENVLFVGGANN